MNKIKILYVISSLKIGGTERRFISLVTDIYQNSLFELQILLLSDKIEFDSITKAKIPIHIIDRKNTSVIKFLYLYYSLIRNYSPTIIHAWDGITAFYTSILKSVYKFKFINSQIASAPDDIPRISKVWIMSRISFYFSDFLISNTKIGLKIYNAPIKRSICIYNGFDLSRLTNNADSEIIKKYKLYSKFIIAMIANFTDYKDQKTLIYAAKSILKNRRNIVFLFLGAGARLAESQSLLESNLEKENIKFLGQVHNVDSIIKHIDIGVLTTYTEGFSNTILEYMAFGKPVIVTSNPGTRELVVDDENGFLVETDNHNDLVNKLEKLIEDDQKRMEMGERNSLKVKKEFDLKKMTNSYLEIYENQSR